LALRALKAARSAASRAPAGGALEVETGQQLGTDGGVDCRGQVQVGQRAVELVVEEGHTGDELGQDAPGLVDAGATTLRQLSALGHLVDGGQGGVEARSYLFDGLPDSGDEVDRVVGIAQLADGLAHLDLVSDDGLAGGAPFVLHGLGGGDTLLEVRWPTGSPRPNLVGGLSVPLGLGVGFGQGQPLMRAFQPPAQAQGGSPGQIVLDVEQVGAVLHTQARAGMGGG
jgi:hypothetical protein